MTNSYLSKATAILNKYNIKVNDIHTKEDIKKSKNFNATLTPSLKRVVAR